MLLKECIVDAASQSIPCGVRVGEDVSDSEPEGDEREKERHHHWSILNLLRLGVQSFSALNIHKLHSMEGSDVYSCVEFDVQESLFYSSFLCVIVSEKWSGGAATSVI